MAVRFRLPVESVFSTDTGVPINLGNGTLNFYQDDTLSATTVYSDIDRNTPAGSAGIVTLDAAGQYGDIYLPNAIVRVRVKNSSGTVLPNGDFDVDGVDTEDVDVTLEHTYDGGGAVPTTGIKGDKRCDFTGTIIRWTLEADQAGSMVLDIWKKPFSANSPPTISNTITASAKPTLSTAQSATSTALTGWTTAVTAGDTFRFNVDSISTLTRYTLTLTIRRTIDIAS